MTNSLFSFAGNKVHSKNIRVKIILQNARVSGKGGEIQTELRWNIHRRMYTNHLISRYSMTNIFTIPKRYNFIENRYAYPHRRFTYLQIIMPRARYVTVSS